MRHQNWILSSSIALMAAITLIAKEPAVAESGEALFHLAENKVPVAMIKVDRTPQHTEVDLEVQKPTSKVCWYSTGPNSPYLLADGHRYRFLSGDHIAICPNPQDYAAHEKMVLRFEPVPAGVHELSLLEGQGGENQTINPAANPNTHFWNFLHVKLQ